MQIQFNRFNVNTNRLNNNKNSNTSNTTNLPSLKNDVFVKKLSFAGKNSL